MSSLGGPRCPNLRALCYVSSVIPSDCRSNSDGPFTTHTAWKGMVLARTAGDWDRKQTEPFLPTSLFPPLFPGFVATGSFLSSGGQTGYVRELLGHMLRLRALPPPPPPWWEESFRLLSFHSFFLHYFPYLLRFRLFQARLSGFRPAYSKVYAWKNILGSSVERRMPR